MKKIGFVTPWFGLNITGGAEAQLRDLIFHLSKANLDLEVLTTCVKDFNSNWNVNYHKAGITIENNITVKRFKVRQRDTALFDSINCKLMKNVPITRSEEKIFIREMINSPDLYQYMKDHDSEYELFVFIPYMFGTTYYGARVNLKKSVLIPCFHDESYFYMNIYKETFSQVRAIMYNSFPEQKMTEKNYPLVNVKQKVMGEGMDTDISGNADAFRKKFKIDQPFLIYAGRKDAGKNVDVLLKYFSEYHKRNSSDLQLVLIGGGQIDIPGDVAHQVHDLGFVEKQDKYNACAAAEFLCQPSHNESFSLVIMESWLCGRPILVNDACAVTKNFAIESNGGLYFKDYFEFEATVNYLLDHKDIADEMGCNGRTYVKEHFEWSIIVERHLQFFRELATE